MALLTKTHTSKEATNRTPLLPPKDPNSKTRDRSSFNASKERRELEYLKKQLAQARGIRRHVENKTPEATGRYTPPAFVPIQKTVEPKPSVVQVPIVTVRYPKLSQAGTVDHTPPTYAEAVYKTALEAVKNPSDEAELVRNLKDLNHCFNDYLYQSIVANKIKPTHVSNMAQALKSSHDELTTEAVTALLHTTIHRPKFIKAILTYANDSNCNQLIKACCHKDDYIRKTAIQLLSLLVRSIEDKDYMKVKHVISQLSLNPAFRNSLVEESKVDSADNHARSLLKDCLENDRTLWSFLRDEEHLSGLRIYA